MARTSNVIVLSLGEFKAVIEFAHDFFRVISSGIPNIGTALIGRQTSCNLLRGLKCPGVDNAWFDLPSKHAAKQG